MNHSATIAIMGKSFDIMIAGVQKAGTSSLSRYLSQHPHIIGHMTREFPYFVRKKLYQKDFKHTFDKYYSVRSKKDQKLLAKSVGISYLEKAVKRLKKHSPNCKIVILLRDPVERAYSAYWHMRYEGWETKDTFEAALAAEEKRIQKGGDVAIHCSYCTRGRYPEQIVRLERLFSPENVHIILLRDLNEASIETCQSVFDFTGVDPTFQPSVDAIHNTAKKARSEMASQLLNRFFQKGHLIKRVFRSLVSGPIARKVRKRLQILNQTDFIPPPMKTDTRQALAEYFEPHNLELESMLGRSLDHWTRA
jgi:hypothetical protein